MIQVHDLVHRYGDTAAVDGVSLSIVDGEFVVIAGANGSGKTTLIRHFNALLEPDEGAVHVNGRPAGEDPVAARSAIGMVFQDPRDCFVAATVGTDVAFGPENLGLPRDAIDERVDGALAAVRMAGRGEDRIEELSGGERSRVAIAGALAMRPDHLVLDEPFAGLDAPARAAVLDRIASLHDGGTSVVVVTHDLANVVDLADRLVILADGRVAFDGPPDAASDVERFGVAPPC